MTHKTLLIGANGQVGKLVASRMQQQGLTVKAMIRNELQSEFFQQHNIETVVADLEQNFEHVFEGCDQLVFSAGSGASTGFDKTLLIDLWAAIKAIRYAEQHQLKRFIMVSSRGATNPDNGPERIKPYLVAKHAADFALTHSTLDYTILQPGRLLNEAATGLFTCDRPSESELQVISREDVADAIVYCLQNKETNNKTYELFRGNRPLSQVLT